MDLRGGRQLLRRFADCLLKVSAREVTAAVFNELVSGAFALEPLDEVASGFVVRFSLAHARAPRRYY